MRSVEPGTPPVALGDADHWVACGAREFGPVGDVRHIIRRGGITTVCGCTATVPEVWRSNVDKPRCAACVEAYVRPRRRPKR